MRTLHALLPSEEAEWIGAQRSRPLQLLCALRRELHSQFRLQNLPTHLHRKLDEDVRELDLIVGNCERLFSSPLPPTMSRHIVRCMLIWLFGFPFVLAGTMAPLTVAMWVFVTSYAFVGIDEIGVQVEQPFEIVPMTHICQIVTTNLRECFVTLPPYSLPPCM
uniref:Bestrophin homolog n=2 Tax=Calcidiscus leptoporus TaxID=127549 RepID=A0A7S0JI74_9EUKA|mmetsp:Transcript_59107/g.135542  ORF Transcript_59107/g.135542 Transcript_59107/m.135542 type:complete len:163 (+) Transcript_59107:84-572(+)